MHLFIDSSVLPKKSAIGCYLLLEEPIFTEDIKTKLKTVTLSSVTSTDAELELAIYVLEKTASVTHIYTDCSNLYGLPNRHYSPNHKKAEKYDKLLKLIDGKQLIKVKGHNKQANKINDYDKIFGCVDKAARKQLRQNID
jgi:hypothetical protein